MRDTPNAFADRLIIARNDVRRALGRLRRVTDAMPEDLPQPHRSAARALAASIRAATTRITEAAEELERKL